MPETVADGKNVLGGSFEIFIDGDTRGFVFDFGVFEAVVEGRLATGGQYDAIDADHFFFLGIFEYNAFREFVFFEGDNFGTGKDGDTEFLSKIFG